MSSSLEVGRKHGYLSLVATLIIESVLITLLIVGEIDRDIFITLFNLGLILVVIVLVLIVCEFDRRIENFEDAQEGIEIRWQEIKDEALKRGFDMNVIIEKIDNGLKYYDEHESTFFRWLETGERAYHLLGPALQRAIERANEYLDRVERLGPVERDSLANDILDELDMMPDYPPKIQTSSHGESIKKKPHPSRRGIRRG